MALNQGFNKPLFGSSSTFGSGNQQNQGGGFGSSGSVFGQPSTSGGGLFAGSGGGGLGAPASGGLFGNQNKQVGGFGASNNNFGSTPMAGGGGGGGSLFGGGNSSLGGGGGGGGFGSSMSTGGMMGGTGGGSIFGASTGSAFGQPSGSSTFGSTGGGFGQTTSAFGQANNTGFGASSATPFGGAGGGMMGGAKGTAGTKYQITTGEYDATQGGNLKYHSICMMSAYKNKSPEELRYEDYMAGNKGGSGMAGGAPSGGSVFGAAGGGGGMGGASGGMGGASGGMGGASGGFGVFGGQSSSSSLWGTPNPASQSAFGAASAPAFGASTSGSIFGSAGSAFNSSPGNTGGAGGGGFFGKPAGTGFGATPASSGGLFGGSTMTSTFGAPSASNPSQGAQGVGLGGTPGNTGSLFGSSTTSAPAFGAANTSGGLFGGGLQASQSSPQSTNPLGGSTFGGMSSSGFNFSASAAQSGAKAFSTPTLSTPGQFGSGLSGGLFSGGANAGSTLPSTSFGFNQTPAAQPSTSLFNSAPAMQNQQPLQASIVAAPFGSSALFSSPATAQAQSTGVSLVAAPVDSAIGGSAQNPSSNGALSAPVYRRTPRSTAKVRPRSFAVKSGPLGGSSSIASLFGSTNGAPMFSSSTFLGGKEESPWKSPEKESERTGSIKKLVIEPTGQTPLVTRTLTLSDMKKFIEEKPQSRKSTPSKRDRESDQPENKNRPGSSSTTQRLSYGSPDQDSNRMEASPIKPTPVRSQGTAFTNRQNPVGASSSGEPSNARAKDLSMSLERKDVSEIEAELQNGSNGHLLDSRLPILTKKDYYTVPDLMTLRTMADEDLQNIDHFTVGKVGVGEVVWFGKTDVRGLDLDSFVQLEPREVIVYADEDDKPPVGEGLNKPAEVSLEGIYKRDKQTGEILNDEENIAALRARLEKHCQREGLTFISYKPSAGIWTFRAEHFSSYRWEDM